MSIVTYEDLIAGWRSLGLAAGDMVMVHSSLSSFGLVEGGAPAVVSALLEILTPAGTLVAPTFSKYLQGEPEWDRERTPSLMGAISETVRTWPGALRSSHAAHPLAAIGAQAELICRRPHRTGFGTDSPFMTLIEQNSWVLLMGVTYSNCTLFHLLEAEAQVPYRFMEERKAVVVINGVRDESGGAWEFTRLPGAVNDFLTLGHELEEMGLVHRATIGNSEQRLFRAADTYRVGSERMAEDPLYLLTENSRKMWQKH
ncbi:MAG: AAC(3) family N-acetyltransferase [Armatimonadota bacterium]